MGRDDKCEMPPSKHRRLASFEPSQVGHKTFGRPLSEADMLIVVRRAKCMPILPLSPLLPDMQADYRNSRPCQWTPGRFGMCPG